MSSLFDAFQLGDLTLSNRVVMGPMTRSKATPEGVPVPIMAEHYAQRASAGLIITEGTFPERAGQGYCDIPGIETQEQEDAWRPVADAVHAEGGHIFMQIEHTGRAGHEINSGGVPMVSSTSEPADFMIYTHDGYIPMTKDVHELTTAEAWEVIDAYGRAAGRARSAGLDGVELHSASGYLPHQFLSDLANKRDDEFGGTAAKRTEFTVRCAERMLEAFGPGRVGVKISPNIVFNGIAEKEYEETYSILIDRLNGLDLAYLCFQTPESLRSLGGQQEPEPENGEIWHRFPYEFIRERYHGVVMASGDLTKNLAQKALDAGKADLFVFGRAYVSNPDLVARMEHDWPQTPYSLQGAYGGGAEGYTDFPTWEEEQQRAASES